MDRMEQVKHLRTDPGGRHYNCAQSILVPFANEAGLGEEQAYQLGAMFGSGMNHGATCGVLTSALMLLGLKGYSAKEAGELLRRFREEHQATECAALLTGPRRRASPGRSTVTLWSLRWSRRWRS